MKIFILIIASILLALIQIEIMPYYNFAGVWPNIALMATVVLAMSQSLPNLLTFTMVGAIILDLASPNFFGLNIFFMVMIAIGLKFLAKRFISEPNVFLIIIFAAIASLINSLLFLLIQKEAPSWPVLAEALYGAVAAVLLFYIFKAIYKPIEMLKIT